MKNFKSLKITFFIFSLVLMPLSFFNHTTYAKEDIALEEQEYTNFTLSNIDSISTEKLNNGDYVITVISSDLFSDTISNISTISASKTITKTKTTYYKSSAGSVLWSVSIKATFSYNGSTSKCTNCSHSTTSPGKSWSIKSCTSSKSGNSATAKAVATHTDGDGSKYNINRSVTISCNANGKVS